MNVKIDKKTKQVLDLTVKIGKEEGLTAKEARTLYSRYNGGDLTDPVQARLFRATCKCYATSGMKGHLFDYLHEYHDPYSIEE